MRQNRLAWLDALRGYAAVVVAAFHLSPVILGSATHLQIYRVFDLGKYAVLLFFLVSGYVIPMSLERHGSLRRFWVGRLCRIYPAYLATILLAAGLTAAGLFRLPDQLRTETTASVLAHATMLQDLLGVRGIVRPFWTLSFEMLFYLLVAGLFAWRLHRFSGWWAGGLTLVAVLGGSRLPDALAGGTGAARTIVAAVVAVVVAGVVWAYQSSRSGLVRLAGGVSLGLIFLAMANGHATRWVTSGSSAQAMLMLAVMFAGTVVYRAEHRQIGRSAAILALGVVLAGVAVHPWQGGGWCAIAVAGTFAVMFALRHRSMPGVLSWLGTVSYSLYLLHLLVLAVVTRLTSDKPLILLGFTVGTLVSAWACHRWVERPGQRLAKIFIATHGETTRTGSIGKQRESV
ncbi:peptidoglycan/LPS O-acetylase OafA/YrhL [Actinoplanes lutulentus]|uniref:Peptidoglycan/LPS O-acetylase OafA/YrhL n=1 Tax=Actinoplanes lutulentus TaxID=1287878 RepID=A0A327ZKH5_9ACTN|nr:acyltransferase [Actinoplanes lutulentus]MBB2944012.1 peptidoglycan/LPS O-acetylase OafA/YrhL [Actinoplanes lutulentus]RAK42755.1 peptidoglycan/LPS O-acetylase OafA/YrhL [Actinoplanes lutulentus]